MEKHPEPGEGVDLPEVEAFVLANRQGVLKRAVKALDETSITELQAVAHKISGSLLLYGYKKEGDLARSLSDWLETVPESQGVEVLRRRDALLEVLRSASI